MKKVLLINNSYPTTLFPNRSTYIQSIEDALIQAKISVDKIVRSSNHSSFGEKLINYLVFYWRLLVFSNYKSYKYIYIHHFPFAYISLLPHFSNMERVVINWHGEDLVPTNVFNKFLCSFSYKFLRSYYTHIVPSEYFKEILIKKLRINHQNIIISPSGGVDTDLFVPLNNKKRGDIINIGFASGIANNKGIDFIEYCINHQNDLPKKVVFHIIDYGKDREKYYNQLLETRNVVLHPVYKKFEMPIFYGKIDILAFPTKSESLGLVALEAMSCGVPIVGPAHFALRSIISNGVNGESYENLEYRDFFNALVRCINNIKKYSTRRSVRQYSKAYVIQQFKEIFV